MTTTNSLPSEMQAVRVHETGGIDAMVYEKAPLPTPTVGQALVQVKAAGVGPWDALVRSGASKLGQPLPLIPGSDVAGIVVALGPSVTEFEIGDEIFGTTNPMFTGGYADYAAVETSMIALKPPCLSYVEAASVPVVAVTAWQMIFEQGKVKRGTRVLVQGASGSVGAYAVQFAKSAGAEVFATAFAKNIDYVRSLGADKVIDVSSARFEDDAKNMDVVIDTVGGDTQNRSFGVLNPGGILVSVVSLPDQDKAKQLGITAVFFYVTVTTECLTLIAERLQSGKLAAMVGDVLTLTEARLAHEMLAGKPHKRGKIVLAIENVR